MLFDIHKMLSTEAGKSKLLETLKYNFMEIKENKIKQMLDNLQLFYSQIQGNHKLEELDDLGILNHQKNIDINKLNAIYLGIIFSVFQECEQEFPIPHQLFLDQKAQNLKQIIVKSNPRLLQQDNIKLLDIGCGNCHMTNLVALKLNAEPTGVDLFTSNKMMWVGDVGEPNKLENDIVYYDGIHLTEALKKRTKEFSQLYDVVTLNHVLHHYPSRSTQIEGLQRCIAMLKEGGVLLFSEHATVLNQQYFELQHVLFHTKSRLPSKTLSQSKMTKFCEEQLSHYIEDKHEAHYFSQALLNRICQALGLKRMVSVARGPQQNILDASSTVFTGYVKTTPTLTPKELECYQPKKLSELLAPAGPLKALEEGDQIALGMNL